MSNARSSLIVVLLSSTALAACGGHLPSPAHAGSEYRGHLTESGGRSLFRPCDAAPGDTLWWAIYHGEAARQRERLEATGVLNLPRPAFARVHAEVSRRNPPGSAQRGTSREIYIQDLIDVRPTGSC
jgi:hypothetical protein